eukprot:CAMPEP_0174855548 /NCGR_PEP_ID=MMETSP1114-20130205/33530_1 /TAXON_ID=312471 /ORGANISM="Neobodo designis, Strain CCAP 1951/1" /LENGTH=181 /DNA_ID=CAMNT_0016090289 /DNA_START=49 /DNA_END=594 /DNA_ORIENTATION=-
MLLSLAVWTVEEAGAVLWALAMGAASLAADFVTASWAQRFAMLVLWPSVIVFVLLVLPFRPTRWVARSALRVAGRSVALRVEGYPTLKFSALLGFGFIMAALAFLSARDIGVRFSGLADAPTTTLGRHTEEHAKRVRAERELYAKAFAAVLCFAMHAINAAQEEVRRAEQDAATRARAKRD